MPAGAVEHAGRRGTKRFNVKVWKKFTVNVSHKTGSLKVIVAYNVQGHSVRMFSVRGL